MENRRGECNLEKVTVVLDTKLPNLKKAVSVLKQGGIIIYPTESSYAIGCDYTKKNLVKKIFKIKKRPKTKHITTIVPNIKVAKQYTKLTKKEKHIVERFMPGPITLATKGKRGKEFNFRISKHPVALKLAKEFGKPIVATSANTSGEPPIYESEDLHKFFGKVDLILDHGNLTITYPSTVVKVSPRFRTIRKGPISVKDIKQSLKAIK